MNIILNTANNIKGSKDYQAKVSALLEAELERYSTYITRIEIHLSDQDGSHKNTPNSRKCVMEARVEGKKPIVVTTQGDTNDHAIQGGLTKLKAALRTTMEMRKQH